MAMEGRKYTTPITYRYGFQGMEWNIETKTHNTLFRFYSPEYGRWWSPDPIVQPWQSNYSAMDGNPIFFTDPFGLKAGGGGGKSTSANDNTFYYGGSMSEVVVTAPKKTPSQTQAKGVPNNVGISMSSMVNSMNRMVYSN